MKTVRELAITTHWQTTNVSEEELRQFVRERIKRACLKLPRDETHLEMKSASEEFLAIMSKNVVEGEKDQDACAIEQLTTMALDADNDLKEFPHLRELIVDAIRTRGLPSPSSMKGVVLAIIAFVSSLPLLAEESNESKPWITDLPYLSFCDLKEKVRPQYPQRKETYEQINMAQLAFSPEEYVGRRFVLDGCTVRQRFRPADVYLAHKNLAGYVAFDLQPITGGKMYGAFDDDIVFVAKKAFCKQWIPRIRGENYEWSWCVVSGTVQEFKNNSGKPFYGFVIDEFLICHNMEGDIYQEDIFCESPISDKKSPELKAFLVINARRDRAYEIRSVKNGNK